MSKVFGYVIRHPGGDFEADQPRYYFGKCPDELKRKYYEGFNPVLECTIWQEPKQRKCCECGYPKDSP